MIWHIVRFDFSGIDADTRADIERRLADLDAIDEVAWLRVARDIDDANVTGLMTGFASVEDLDTYRTHPDHLPVVGDIRDLEIAVSRIDIATDDDVTALPI